MWSPYLGGGSVAFKGANKIRCIHPNPSDASMAVLRCFFFSCSPACPRSSSSPSMLFTCERVFPVIRPHHYSYSAVDGIIGVIKSILGDKPRAYFS